MATRKKLQNGIGYVLILNLDSMCIPIIFTRQLEICISIDVTRLIIVVMQLPSAFSIIHLLEVKRKSLPIQNILTTTINMSITSKLNLFRLNPISHPGHNIQVIMKHQMNRLLK